MFISNYRAKRLCLVNDRSGLYNSIESYLYAIVKSIAADDNKVDRDVTDKPAGGDDSTDI